MFQILSFKSFRGGGGILSSLSFLKALPLTALISFDRSAIPNLLGSSWPDLCPVVPVNQSQ